jgi:uncharacterized protein YdaU (DUF1376 family)
MPFFFGDFLAATATWDGEQQSLYILLLAYQWSSGPLPSDPARIAKMCRYERKRFDTLWQTVSEKFALTAKGWVNDRLEQHRERAKEISKKRATAGAKGGSASKQKQVSASAKVVSLPKQNGSNCLASASGLYSHPIQTNPEEEEEVRGLPRREV